MRTVVGTFGLALCALVTAVPTSTRVLGINFDSTGRDTPLLKLNYATYKGVYNNATDVYVFKNIRFAAPPIGKLRWAKPAPPLKQDEIQDGSVGRSCLQQRMNNVAVPTIATSGEDCLFLDVTVPGEAIRNSSLRLPVVNWIYGGAYIVGSKEQKGDAEAIVRASKGNLIWVAGNYRLGAYGFLDGTTVEKEGVPNVGFHDQRAVLEWIQKYIDLVGGDKTKVTAMGISAGAGSIVHHLILEGGKLDPLFSKAIIQSPGYMNLQDRAGQMENNYKKFEDFAGCKDKGLDCLRAASESTLKTAADKANALARSGTFTFGPGPDGKFIVNTPTLEFGAGRFWKGLDVVISSRVSDEGSTFIGNQPVTDSSFELLVDSQVGNSTFTKDLKARAQRLYPSTKHIDSPYQSETLRISDYVTESSFTCHNRLVADAYAGKVYTVEYAVSKAKHGADQSATFFNPLKPENRNIAPDMLPNKLAYQSYFTSFARTGNPNTYRNNATIEWPLTTGFDGVTLKNVLRFEQPIGAKGFRLEEDTGETRVHCQFWTDVQKAIQESLVHVN